MIFRSFTRRYGQAYSSLIQDVRAYLEHCIENEVDLSSTVFRGTFYELCVKRYLERHLHAKNLVKCGGAYDNGVDIMGQWNLLPLYEASHELADVNSPDKLHARSLLKSALETKSEVKLKSKRSLSLANDIQLLVQCKNYKKRLSASVIRELSGVMEYQKLAKRSTFMFIVSPHPITAQAVSQLDKSSYALLSLSISPLTNGSMAHYHDFDSWRGGVLSSVYMNKNARNLLSGLYVEQQLGRLIINSNV
ncbi:uncharacterized protein LODBEIA_P19820 [Lodderomyces beijingensis]|uniref:Required for respiratory growth protein 7, mitochondrial n=1 Tax=Lodderomyces beijingensis TaxID=1775926 RepID=A0ABP0ZJE8_9ASCO